MLNWFYKWLGDKIEDTKYEKEDAPNLIGSSTKVNKVRRGAVARIARDESTIDSEPITFKMFKATGGWAIEFRQYDSKNDEVSMSLYVVNNEDELGKHLSQIITMEALKR